MITVCSCFPVDLSFPYAFPFLFDLSLKLYLSGPFPKEFGGGGSEELFRSATKVCSSEQKNIVINFLHILL